MCVGGGGRGSQRLVDFEQILKVSINVALVLVGEPQGVCSGQVGFWIPSGITC